MGISNLIALFIIFATAATLNASGVTDIQTSSQAAEALRPIAGVFTFALFAAGIIATGMLGNVGHGACNSGVLLDLNHVLSVLTLHILIPAGAGVGWCFGSQPLRLA